MEKYLDFFNIHIMGNVQMLVGFHYYTRFLNSKVHLSSYLLFSLLGAIGLTAIQDDGIYSFLLYILLLVVWGLFVCRAGWTAVVLYAVVISEIMQFCYGIFGAALGILYPLVFPFSQRIIGMAFMVLGNAAVFLVIYCCRMVYRYFGDEETVNGQYAALILVPTLLIFLISEYINDAVYGNTLTIDDRGNVLNTNHYQMLVIQLLGLASLFCIMAAYKKLLENVRFHTELSLLRQQERFLNQYVEEAKVHYDRTKSFRHDIRNHLMIVGELLQDGKSSQALDYVSDLEEMAKEMSFPCSTGNPVVDILVGNKLGIAARDHIDVYCSLTLPYPCPIRDIDLCIILANALDNAICACKKTTERYIRVTGNIQGDLVLIEIENSYSYEGNGSIQGTIKEGTGLSNIRKVAEKYQGAVDIKMGDHVVVLSVLLIISHHFCE